MARYLILPGMGGRYEQSITLTADSVDHVSDELDFSQCAHGAIQVTTWASGDLSLQIEQSFNGSDFTELGSGETSVTDGDVITLPPTTGPYGILRVQASSSDTAAAVTLTFIGYPLQVRT
jgi:hypothetical protein